MSIPNIDWNTITPNEIADIVRNLGALNGTGDFVFYQGIDFDQTGAGLANAGFGMIDGSEAHSFLSDNRAQIEAVLDRSPGTTIRMSGSGPDNLWAIASVNLAGEAHGDVLAAIIYGEDRYWTDSVFFQDELPALLANDNVDSINGISRTDLLAMGTQERFFAVRDASRQSIADGLADAFRSGQITRSELLDTLQEITTGPRPLAGIDSQYRITVPFQISANTSIDLNFSLNEFAKFTYALEYINLSNLGKLGLLGDAVDFTLTIYAAGQLLSEGDQQGAERLLAQAGGGFAAAAGGGVIGGLIGASVVAIIGTGGLAAFAIVGAFALGGGAFLSSYGERAGAALYDFMLEYNGDETLLPAAVGDFFVGWLKDEGIYASFVLQHVYNSVADENGDVDVEALGVAIGEALLADPSIINGDNSVLLRTLMDVAPDIVTGHPSAESSLLIRTIFDTIEGTCFTADASITLWDGTSKPIAEIMAGDVVESFDGEGKLVPGRVARTFRGETDAWVELRYMLNGKEIALTATPGHPFLTDDGSFQPISALIEADGTAQIIARDGQLVTAQTELVVYSAATADRYEKAMVSGVVGNAMLKPQVVDAWATYNFEVEQTHTYIAGNARVHNRCLATSVTEATLQALIEAGIVDPEVDNVILTESGQYLILSEDGRLITEGDLEGHSFVKVVELISDYVAHVGHSIESVIEDTPQYLEEALPGLFAALVNGQDFESAIEAYGAEVVANMGVDGLARIFGLERLEELDFPIDPETGQMIIPDTMDPLFFETEIGSAIKGALVSAAVMKILSGEDMTSEDYEQLALNHSVRFVVTQALQTQQWATLGNVTERFTDWFGFEDGAVNLSPAAQAGAAAAVSLLVDLLDGGIEDFGQALGSAAIAAGTSFVTSYVVGTAAVQGIAQGLSTVLGIGAPVIGNIIGAVIGAVFGKLLGKLFGGLFEPLPDLYVVEQNDDGSVTVSITQYSTGYVYTARDGQDDNLIGGKGADGLYGSSGDNDLHGQDGNDRLYGFAGDDLLTGGKGDDRLEAGAGNDQAVGDAGSDTINGGAGNDTVVGGDGDDVLFGDTRDDETEVAYAQRASVARLGEVGEPEEEEDDEEDSSEAAGPDEEDTTTTAGATHNDVLLGGAGNDDIFAGRGDDYADGGAGDDIIFGQSGNDVLRGGAHNDYLSGGSGNDVIDGDIGSDRIYGGSGDDVMHGDKMVFLKDTPVTEAIRAWLNGPVRTSSELKEAVGLHVSYHNVNGLSARPFSGAYTLAEVLLSVVGQVESAVIAGLEGNESDVDSAFMTWLDGTDSALHGQIVSGDFAYLASDYEAPQDDPDTEVNEAGDVPGNLIYTQGTGNDYMHAGSGDDLVYGGHGNDTLLGSAGNDTLFGDGLTTTTDDDGAFMITPAGNGNDSLSGGDGDDEINAGEGANRIDGGDGDDEITSGSGNDTIWGGEGADTISSGSGNDLIRAGASGVSEEGVETGSFGSLDFVVAGAGNDTVYGEDGGDYLSGGNGADYLYGDEGDDNVSGDAGNDYLRGGDGTDFVNGGAGNNKMFGDAGDDILTGGDGADTMSGDAGNDILQGGDGNDSVLGGSGNDTVLGEFGADVIDGGTGNDSLIGGSGHDELSGGDGADALRGGSDNDVLDGDAGNDLLEGGGGTDTLSGGSGNDTITGDHEGAGSDAAADLIDGGSGHDVVDAGAGADTVTGGTGADDITGGSGNDVLHGDDGGDTIDGGSGNDLISGGAGNDDLTGGTGHDVIYTSGAPGGGNVYGIDNASGGSGNDAIYGSNGADILSGDSGNDTLTGGSEAGTSDSDILRGGSGNDVLSSGFSGQSNLDRGDELYGDAGNDVLTGGDAQDLLSGGAGNDILTAGSTGDTLDGGANDDTLITTRGVQVLRGGDGNDLYKIDLAESQITIEETGGLDKIELTAPIEPKDILLEKDGNDLLILSQSNPDYSIRIVDQFLNGPRIEAVSFVAHDFTLDLTNVVIGTDGNDDIVGTENNDVILSLGGDDIIVGAGGDDFLDGGPGKDVLFGNSGNDFVHGSSEDDMLHGGTGHDVINDGIGSDLMIGGSGRDTFMVTEQGGDHDIISDFAVGQDKIGLQSFGDQFVSLKQIDYFGTPFAMSGDDAILSFEAGQTLAVENVHYRDLSESDFEFDLRAINGNTGTGINEIITGTSTADVIDGRGGFDIMSGGAGVDRFVVGRDAGSIDTITDFSAASEVLDLSGFTDVVSIHSFDLRAESGDMIVSFGSDQHLIMEGVNKAALDLGSVDFKLFEDNTAISRYTGEGTAVYAKDTTIEKDVNVSHADVTAASAGLVAAISGAAGADGGTANAKGATGYGVAATSYGIAKGDAGAGTFTSLAGTIDTPEAELTNNEYYRKHNCHKHLVQPVDFFGSAGDEFFKASNWAERIDAGLGNDSVDAGSGNDTVRAGLGHDVVNGEDGHDIIYGDGGLGKSNLIVPSSEFSCMVELADTADWAGIDDDKILGGNGNDKIYGNGGNDELRGQDGNDLIKGGTGSDLIVGGNGTDTLYGESGRDFIYGSAQDDKIYGGDHDDSAWGGTGNDSLYGGGGNDLLRGESGNDYLDGGANNDYLEGGSGHDSMIGGSGNDDMHGGTHNDTMKGGSGNDDLRGNDGNDKLYGETGHDYLDGDAGDDYISGSSGQDKIIGDTGNDTLYGGSDNDYVSGGTGNDLIDGGTGNDILYGHDGHDTIKGASGNDYIKGYAHNDRIEGGSGNDNVWGGDGNDFVFGETGEDKLFGGTGNDRVDGGDGNDSIGGGTGVDTLTGGAGHDWINGEEGSDAIAGGAGNDRLYGDSGNDHISGNQDEDRLYGGSGADTLHGGEDDDSAWGGTGRDVLVGGTGNDALFGESDHDILSGSDGNDHLDGGTGNDTLKGENGNDLLVGGSGHDHLEGGAGRDVLQVTSGNNFLHGGAGADFLSGGSAHDRLYGGSGSDRIDGGAGRDEIDGGTNADVISGGTGNDNIKGGQGADVVNGDSGDDLIDGGTQNDHLMGDTGLDYLLGGDGNDTVDGGADNDVLEGNAGTDLLLGGSGADRLFGGVSNDTLIGGTGADLMYGGTGKDIFRFEALNESQIGRYDVIADFKSGTDQIDISKLGISFSELDIAKVNGDTIITTSQGNFGFKVIGSGHTLTAADFVFSNVIRGTAANEVLIGDNARDKIIAGAGNDVLDAGSNDLGGWQYLYGQAGNDTYKYGTESGSVYIGNSAESAGTGTDKIVFSDLTLSDVRFTLYDYTKGGTVASAEGEALRILWSKNGESGELRVANGGDAIESFVFADGSTLSGITANYRDHLNADDTRDKLYGSSGNDKITGSAEGNLIYGGAGNDVLDAGVTDLGAWQYLYGQAGNDTYKYGTQSGSVYIGNSAESAGTGTDKIVFSDLTLSDVRFTLYDYTKGGTVASAEGEALRILWSKNGESGELRVANGGDAIESFVFADGSTLSGITANYRDHLNADDTRDKLYGSSGNDKITGSAEGNLIYGGAGNDVLDAGATDLGAWQYLYGQAGNDTYKYGTESGRVYIGNSAESAGTGTDKIVFSDLTLSDVSFTLYDYTKGGTVASAEGEALRILWSKNGESGELRVANGGDAIESFVFSNNRKVAGFEIGTADADTFKFTQSDATGSNSDQVIDQFDVTKDRIDLRALDVSAGDLSFGNAGSFRKVVIDGFDMELLVQTENGVLTTSDFLF